MFNTLIPTYGITNGTVWDNQIIIIAVTFVARQCNVL